MLVLAYLRLTPADWAWVQVLRARHDARYSGVVDPHFTLVFPVHGLVSDTFVAHVERQAKGIEPIWFVLRQAVIEKDTFSAYTHVFLVPDEGYAAIVALHDRLYTGVLAAEQRTDIPFIPHIGVGNAVDPAACRRVATS